MLTPEFLETVLLQVPYRTLLPRQGVRIRRARFVRRLDLSSATLSHPLWLEESTFESEVLLAYVKSPHYVYLHGSHFTKALRLNFSQIDGEVALAGGQFGFVTLHGATIKGQLILVDSVFSGDVNLFSSRVGNAIYMNRSEFRGRVDLTQVEVKGHVSLESATLLKPVNFEGARLEGELRLGFSMPPEPRSRDRGLGQVWVHRDWRQRTQWAEAADLSLRGARSDSVRADRDSWPRRFDLTGFTYARFGRAPRTGDWNGPLAGLGDEPVNCLTSWLERQPNDRYSPQPYEQLATVLRSLGRAADAKDVVYAARRREHRLQGGVWWWLLWVPWAFVGYGLRPHYSLVWVTLLVGIGAIVFRMTQDPVDRAAVGWGIGYSVDMLLPVIRLRERHHTIDLRGGGRYYFYVHKVAGWVLASFVAASVTGLLK